MWFGIALGQVFCYYIRMNCEKPELYLRRKFDAFLQDWKAQTNRLPLIVKGARQVGKTACIRHFAEGRYEHIVEINFVERPEFKSIVRDGYSEEAIVRNISQIDPSFRFAANRTLVFFDEIQEFPEIATSFKFFAQRGNYDVISSGSLLGVHYRRIESLSVGYQESVELRSMDFEEFLWACGYSSDQLDEVYGRLLALQPFSESVQTTYSRLFLDYCTLGGMPNVLETYFVRKSFEGTLAAQHRIIKDYKADIRKYAEGLDPVRIQNVFEDIPFQLAKENKKFQISKVAPGARHKDYWGCVEWLADAGVVNICYSLDFPELPLKAHRDRSAYKLYLADTGLLLAQLDEEAQADVRVRRSLGTWKGGLFENIVAEALVKSGEDAFYFKKDNSTLEMDFFLRSGDDLVPVEVKSENARGKSLRTLVASDHYKDIRWGIKLVNGNVGFENGILTLPQWCAFLLTRLVKDESFQCRRAAPALSPVL